MNLPLPIGAGEEERRGRVEKIAAALRQGTYRIPTELVADAVLAAWRRDLSARPPRS